MPLASRCVPPQASAWGAEAGKSTCCCPSVAPSVEPLSPAATVTVTPSPPPSVRICLHLGARLRRPRVLRAAPADRDDRWLVGRVVDGLRDGVDEPLIGVGREVDDDLGARGDRAGHLDVEHHLAVGVLVGARAVGAAVDRDRGDRRRGDRQPLEVRGEVGLGEAAAELDDPDRLPGAVDAAREAVGLGDLHRRVGRRRRRLGDEADVGSCLGSVVDPEHADDDVLEVGGDRQRARAGPVPRGARLGRVHPLEAHPERVGDRLHRAVEPDRSARLVDLLDDETVGLGERGDGVDGVGVGAVRLGPLVAGDPPARLRRAPRLLVDPFGRDAVGQVDGHVGARLRVDVPYAHVRRVELPLRAGDFDAVRSGHGCLRWEWGGLSECNATRWAAGRGWGPVSPRAAGRSARRPRAARASADGG